MSTTSPGSLRPTSPPPSPPARPPRSRRPRRTSTGSAPSTAPCTPSSTSTARARSRRRLPPTSVVPTGGDVPELLGVPIAVKDVVDDQGAGHHRRLAHPRGLGAAVRRHPGHPAARRRSADPGQDQHGRVRDGQLDRALRLRRDPQPVGPRPHPRRLRRRLVGGRHGVRGAAGDRHRHRRLDPAARRGHRHGRGEADLRRRLALRPDRAGQQPRPGRPRHSHRARRRPAARRDRRPRPDGLHQHRPRPGRRWPRRPGAPTSPASRSASSRSSAARATRPACGPASTRPCSSSSRPAPRSSRSPARTSSTPSLPTT